MQAYLAPKTVQELYYDLGKLTEQSKLISGGTDLVIRLNMGVCRPDALLYMGGIDGLDLIEDQGDTITVGATATMSAIAENPLIREKFTALADAAADVGCKQIRNNGTIGGNVANASAAGDLIPVLFLYKAKAQVATSSGTMRELSMPELVIGPGKTSLTSQEAIIRFMIQKPSHANSKNAFVKLGSRKALTISRIGLAVELNQTNDGVIEQASVVAGAISLTPVHVAKAEEYLIGKKLDQQAFYAVGKALSDLIMEITPEMFDRDYKAQAAYGIAEDVLKKLI